MQPIMITSAHDIYKKQSVLTASPLELIVMLYDGMKKQMLLAKRRIEKKDMSGAHESLMKAQAIVTELAKSLDMTIPLSKELEDIYEYLIYAMSYINLKKETELIGPVIEMIDELKDAWETISNDQHGSMQLIDEL